MAFGFYFYYVPLIIVLAAWSVGFSTLKVAKLNYNAIAVLNLVFLFAIIGLRSEDVGNDTARYLEEFNNSIEDLSFGGRGSEVGFTYILAIFKSFGLTFELFNVIYASFLLYALVSIFRHSRFLLFFVLASLYFAGYFFMGMSGMRQMLSVSFFLLSCRHSVSAKGVLLKILLFILAVTVHNSSVVAFPLFFATILTSNFLSIRLRNALIILFFLFALILFWYVDFDSVASSTKYDYYSSLNELRPLSLLNVVFWVSLSFLSMFAAFLNDRNLRTKIERYKLKRATMCPAEAYSLFIYVYAGGFTAFAYCAGLYIPLMDRFSYYFQPFIFAAIGIYVVNIKNRKFRRVVGALLIISGAIFMTRLLQQDPFGLFG